MPAPGGVPGVVYSFYGVLFDFDCGVFHAQVLQGVKEIVCNVAEAIR